MDDEFTKIRAALAAMTNGELGALQATAQNSPQMAPGLLAYLAHICDWELSRREGYEFALNGDPHAAIGREEFSVSFLTLTALSAGSVECARVGNLLGVIDDAIRAGPVTVH